MKKGFIAVMALVVTFYFSSCTKKAGMSEETKTLMNNFETSWNSADEQMKNWGQTMNTTFSDMNKMMDESMPMHDMSKMKPAEKASADSMMMMCNTIKAQMESMKTMYNTEMDAFKADKQAYDDWKKKGQEEKMDDATIKAGLDTWNVKLAEWNTKMGDWNEQLTGIQAACKTTCDAMAMKTM